MRGQVICQSSLTEENSEVLGLLNHGLQHGPGDQLDVALHLHLSKPVQHLLLHSQVSLIQVRNTLLKRFYQKC